MSAAKIRFSKALLHPRFWPVWCAIALWWLLVQVLPFALQMWFGAQLGYLVAYLSPRRRMIARKNIDLCFPELSPPARVQLYRQTMAATGRAVFDTGIAWFWPYWRLRRVLDVSGIEHLHQAQAEGDGVLAFTYHFTAMEVGLAAINRHYPRANCGVYRPHANPVYDYVMRKGRERHGQGLEALPRRDVRGMVRRLRAGRLLFFLPDQDYGYKHSVFVPFFGVAAATVTSPTQLRRLGKARVVPITTWRQANGRYQVQVYPQLTLSADGDAHTDARLGNAFLQSLVQAHPEQYLWVHRRFKSRPDQQADFYGLQALTSFRRRNRRRAKAKALRRAGKRPG